MVDKTRKPELVLSQRCMIKIRRVGEQSGIGFPGPGDEGSRDGAAFQVLVLHPIRALCTFASELRIVLGSLCSHHGEWSIVA
jgi:hypothetical protein